MDRRENGFAMVITLVLLLVMTISGLIAFQVSSGNLTIFGFGRAKADAQSSAEACTNVATRQILGLNFAALALATPDVTCTAATATLSNTLKPLVGYEYGDGALQRFKARTVIVGQSPMNGPSQSRTVIVQLWQ